MIFYKLTAFLNTKIQHYGIRKEISTIGRTQAKG